MVPVVVDDTQVSSPTTSTHTEWKQEKQELERQIREQATQIERIQADLQAKINRSKDLEDQLAQAIELAHSRDARFEEMMLKFEQLLNLQAGLTPGRELPWNDDDDDNPNPETPERLQSTGPPPPKKPNQNASPHRKIYSIFRQQQHRENPPIVGKQNDKMMTQPMETDEEPRQLQLSAKLSKKME